MATQRLPAAERKIAFKDAFAELISKHNIQRSKFSKHDHATRISHLCKKLIIGLFGSELGMDAATCFYDYAIAGKLYCDPLPEERKSKDLPFQYQRIFEDISFSQYFELIDELLDNKREPIKKRTPITSYRLPVEVKIA